MPNLRRADQNYRMETRLSLLILAILIGIGGAIFHRQFDFNAAVAVGRLAHGDIQPPVSGESADTERGWSAFLPDMAELTPPEVFNAENLYDKINGKADLYLSAGFRELKSQRFKMVGDENTWLEIFVYDMGNLQNAFSVLSQQRREDAVETELGRFSYRTENALFFLHGPFYVELIGSEATASLLKQMHMFSRNFLQSIPVNAETLEELELFPKENLDPNSMGLIAGDAFGYDRFDRMFTADYTVAGSRMTAFISRRSSPMEAQQLVQGYHDFLIAFGGKALQTSLPIDYIYLIEIIGSYELFFTQKMYLAGVHEAVDKEQAEHLARLLDKKLREGKGEHR